MGTSTVTTASEITAGDRITEYDTPEGPFYDVVKVNPKSILVDIGYGDTVRLPIRSSDLVRIAG